MFARPRQWKRMIIFRAENKFNGRYSIVQHRNNVPATGATKRQQQRRSAMRQRSEWWSRWSPLKIWGNVPTWLKFCWFLLEVVDMTRISLMILLSAKQNDSYHSIWNDVTTCRAFLWRLVSCRKVGCLCRYQTEKIGMRYSHIYATAEKTWKPIVIIKEEEGGHALQWLQWQGT